MRRSILWRMLAIERMISPRRFKSTGSVDELEGKRNPKTRPRYRGGDLLLGYVIAIAVSIGFVPLLPDNVEFRYTLTWGILAGVSVLSWLLGSMERIGQERPDDLGWGVLYAVMLGIPFLVFLSQPLLSPVVDQFFPGMSPGSLLAFLVFVMPIAETLFFRGLVQDQLPFWIVGLLATFWNVILFMPVLGTSATEFMAVTFVIVILLLMMNLLYTYVRMRKGLAAAWICQIVANLIILYLPSLSTI